jgi:hypothetical protein
MSGPALFFSLADVFVNPSNGLDSRGIVERPCLGTPGFWHFEEHGIRTLLEVRVVPQGQGGVVAYNFKLICGKESVILDVGRAYAVVPSARLLLDGQDLVDAAPSEDDPVTVSRIADSHVLALLSVVMEMLSPEPNGDGSRYVHRQDGKHVEPVEPVVDPTWGDRPLSLELVGNLFRDEPSGDILPVEPVRLSLVVLRGSVPGAS